MRRSLPIERTTTSPELRPTRIWSSMPCLGLYVLGAVNFGGCAVRLAPHSWQNLFDGGLAAPQPGHRASRRVPHSPQNFTAVGFSYRHAGHCIRRLTLTDSRHDCRAAHSRQILDPHRLLVARALAI